MRVSVENALKGYNTIKIFFLSQHCFVSVGKSPNELLHYELLHEQLRLSLCSKDRRGRRVEM